MNLNDWNDLDEVESKESQILKKMIWEKMIISNKKKFKKLFVKSKFKIELPDEIKNDENIDIKTVGKLKNEFNRRKETRLF